jgi:hypothetical protein
VVRSKVRLSQSHLAPQDERGFASQLDKNHLRIYWFLHFLNVGHLIDQKVRRYCKMSGTRRESQAVRAVRTRHNSRKDIRGAGAARPEEICHVNVMRWRNG